MKYSNVMEERPLFSVVIVHYRQLDLWRQAVDSVLLQSYPTIQLIFADDGTPNFDVSVVEAYIKEKARENLKALKVTKQVNNLGTVSNFNIAHAFCTGKYLLHLAADDVLYDNNVLENYAKELDSKSGGVCGIYGRSIKCDENLQQTGEEYIDPKDAEKYNAMSGKQQFVRLAKGCCFPMGAMAFLLDNFLEYMPFDEKYCLLEDWPFFLRVTYQGQVFKFVNFPALYYRAGGVSRNTERIEKRIAQKCYLDNLNIHAFEIWPYRKELGLLWRMKIFMRYEIVWSTSKKTIGSNPTADRYALIKAAPQYGILFPAGKGAYYIKKLLRRTKA